mmetsp:Transcript_35402/g.85673  ORF Transcript_35402/g.85673 Transcript_35402/m.85673 type:complete len:213 (-) Transcript_35402:8-646(-)
MHCLLTGRSVTGILHFVNQTPMDWYCKKQATVETATFGSEYISGRTCVEQAIDLRNTYRYFGVPVRDKSYMFGDNDSMINSATRPESKLHKRHVVLSYHRVREAVASGMIVLCHIRSHMNPADILSKHWTHNSIWRSLQPLLFWAGDTMDCYQVDDAKPGKTSNKKKQVVQFPLTLLFLVMILARADGEYRNSRITSSRSMTPFMTQTLLHS